ncbi:hypothetical protein AgCh_003194 [Apium graveolens]
MANELRQRLHTVVKQREELQLVERGVKAELISRSHVTSLHNTYESHIKEHANANVKFQATTSQLSLSTHVPLFVAVEALSVDTLIR